MPSPEESARELIAALAEARTNTDDLFRVVRPGSLYERPIPERHRIIFYLGHLEAFDWNLVALHVLGIDSFHQEFDRLFAFGIDPVDGALPTDQPADWPSVKEIEEYNQRVRQTMDEALEKVSFSHAKQPLLYRGYVLNVALEHRLMHAETFAYMLHQLSLKDKFSCPETLSPRTRPVTPRMVTIPAGATVLGLRREDEALFGWDNEFEQHEVAVPEFAIDVYKVTNREFLDFMKAGGYRERTFWTGHGWQWRETQGIDHPNFWTRRGNEWFHRTMFDEIPLPPDWPVYVSHAEAGAYARWAGKSLPTEAQFHRAAYGTPQGFERQYPWGNHGPQSDKGNFDFHRWDPAPVGAHPAGASPFGVADLLGNGWEWTSTVFEPFQGFRPFPFYPGYSANFFDGKHYVVKGGSCRTAARLLRRSFRNWFQNLYPYVYAGFRCVTNDS
ncbi:MAG: ergothioneine biosynthesis protein EgtB [Acidobacteria bacterium]|nr:ergothioneine biosynthesis protein EgtB [Acidobacteriota bacterium]